jgi:hypothetical protein
MQVSWARPEPDLRFATSATGDFAGRVSLQARPARRAEQDATSAGAEYRMVSKAGRIGGSVSRMRLRRACRGKAAGAAA